MLCKKVTQLCYRNDTIKSTNGSHAVHPTRYLTGLQASGNSKHSPSPVLFDDCANDACQVSMIDSKFRGQSSLQSMMESFLQHWH